MLGLITARPLEELTSLVIYMLWIRIVDNIPGEQKDIICRLFFLFFFFYQTLIILMKLHHYPQSTLFTFCCVCSSTADITSSACKCL